jgi:hypothetical protein
MVTDYSKLPRETYYACPHCMLPLNFYPEEDLEHVTVKAADNDSILSIQKYGNTCINPGEPVSSPQATRPSKSCRHFLGYLRTHSEREDIPDECAVCPHILKCYIKQE